MEYAKIFLHLMQQQNTLFSDSPQNGSKPAPESRLAMLESLERNMSRFHDHQTDTLRVHERSLQDQTEYTQNLFHLMQQRCSLLLEGGQTASFYSAWEQTLQTQARIKAAPVTQPEIPKPQLTADPVPVAASSAAPPVQFSSNGNGIPASISPPESLSGNGSAVQTPIAGKIEQTPVVDAPSIHTSTDSTANLSTILLAIVSEKTGYPVEMLELEMDMEADLGIDSIKRVEILGALQAQFPSSVQPNPDDLAELRTLGQIVAYMQAQPLTVQSESAKSFDPVNIVDAKAPAISVNSTSHKGDDHNGHHNGSGNGDSVTTTVAASAATLITPKVDLPSLDQANRDVNGNGIPPSLQKSITPAVIAVDSSRLSEHLLAVVSEKTGYPAEMLEMEMDMEADLGIDSIKRVEILGALQERFPASYEPTPEDLAELRTLNQIVSFLGEQVAEKKTANQQLVASPVS
ncbi:MAG: hypothetical protein HC768_06465 [Acaryochloris sp. CRU_2_0]|nr:hypothetical protein [Acaryochloris sp. CRU_2_0]